MTDGTHVELYVRSLLPRHAQHQQEAVVERLLSLEADGPLDDLQIVVWGRQAPASPADTRTDAGLFALNRVAVFTKWAERNGFSVDAQFDQRSVDSTMADERYRAITFPMMTLAEYRDRDLTFVAPVEDGPETISVPDRLDTIEAADGSATETTEPLEESYAQPPPAVTLDDEEQSDLTEL